VVGLGELVKHKGGSTIPFERLGFSSEREVMEIHEKLRKTHRTYGNLADAFGVNREEFIKCVLFSESRLEAVALYMVKKGKTKIDKREFVALLVLIDFVWEMTKELMKQVMEMTRKEMTKKAEENKAYL
jgi:hypothetical protein